MDANKPIQFTNSLEGITTACLTGFFVGWTRPLSPEQHLQMFHNSYATELAIDAETGRIVGFINAITDNVHAAFIPCLEVLPEYQGQGIGSELTRRILDRLHHLRCVDLTCDADIQPFYKQFAMQPSCGMVIRRHMKQTDGNG
jgi:ribosomal protein S18 acetylase RimI-like enzyme